MDTHYSILNSFPGDLVVKNPSAKRGDVKCRRRGFNPWVRKIPWRREWQKTPAFLPGKSHEKRSLEGYSPLGHKELDMMSMHAWAYIKEIIKGPTV